MGIKLLGSLHCISNDFSIYIGNILPNPHMVILNDILAPIFKEMNQCNRRNLEKQELTKNAYWCLSNIFAT